MVSVACRVSLRVAVPRGVAPSMNVTMPVGRPAAGATTFTVAVKVSVCPTDAGFADEVKVVVVLPLLIVSVTAFDRLEATLLSPL